MSKLYYFAYGSNLHPVRLQKRVPTANFLGLITVPGYRLCFHKRHHDDNSGKCNMFLTNQSCDVVHGALFEMNQDEKPLLDECEGVGYRCDTLQLQLKDASYQSFIYIAEDSHIDDSLTPHRWYREIVLLGAEHHDLPSDYVDRIRKIAAAKDPDARRHDVNSQLIEEMRAFTSNSTNKKSRK